MSISSILKHTSFSTLDEAEQNAVRRLFDDVYQKKQRMTLDVLEIFKQRQFLSTSLDIYGKKLAHLNPASFKFLSKAQRIVLEEDLLFTFYLLSAQYQLDEAESRRQNLQQRSEQIKHCADLINRLRQNGLETTPETILEQAMDDSEKHLKYLGLTVVGPFIAEKAVEFSGGRTTVIKSWMGDINERRLYWVWGGGLLSSVIGLMPEHLGHKNAAQQVLGTPAPVLGYASWILYYTRFGIELSLLLKHTIKGPWMSKEEQQIPAWERFKTQWQQRKFMLLNDAVWATVNLVTFFWLTGSGILGYWGNIITAGLLLVDASLTLWRFYEETTRHNEELARYARDIEALKAKLHDEDEKNAEARRLMQRQIASLEKMQQQCEFDWKYKKYKLINDLTYAIALVVAFSVVCCFFFPPAALMPATTLILGVVGAALCFSLTLSYSAASGGIEIAKSRATGKLAREECEKLLQLFNESNNEFEKKQLYLDIKQSMAESVHQERLIRFQKISLVRSVLIDAMLPALMFVSLMFLPTGIGIGVIAAGIALALLSRIILKQFEPKADALPEFDEEDYEKFAQKPELAHFNKDEIKKEDDVHKKSGFFTATARKDGYKPVPQETEEDAVKNPLTLQTGEI
ncbi:hypothetical protein [Legionella oakridgensis]|uniref:Coiled-coil protein n=1 Tax=Legionella oakridgensis TaxID=29423 RepID=A0A0W0X1F3_9GAMM|nr:hypothetical protein [Legionella oakridgensis]KTD38386.1 coiled-coil protein [Legionella oakridgensis]STY21397.1 coiled-coil protein [Legionella longbeachae]